MHSNWRNHINWFYFGLIAYKTYWKSERYGKNIRLYLGIVIRIVTIPSYIVFGLGQGFQPVAGYNYGANQPKRVLDSFKYTVKVTTIVMLVTAFIFNVFGFLILKLFQTTETMEAYAILALRYQSIGLIFLGAINTVTIFFQALGKGFKALLMSVARQGLFFIPMILIIPGLMGVDGVMLSQSFADILSLILALALVIPFLYERNLKHLSSQPH